MIVVIAPLKAFVCVGMLVRAIEFEPSAFVVFFCVGRVSVRISESDVTTA